MSLAQLGQDLFDLSNLVGEALERADQTCDREGRAATYADIIIARDQILAERKIEKGKQS